ncbi:FtsW/RodA/SpoVE family cell cycle protein [Ligilactobacillus agilis]|uniref:Probable peptidoglycan glycosyltransferase FtsW n=1 Tax=Ligilactobacillus agilis TaxID=1601 RepID=A0A9Q9J609_9LACO|nr:FtsW/RodA/SpoVE family cell cycle protein [Ligilactobacillus agilis]MBL1056354.1 FtsW/RodA/SpoVE family cell cycle protein [Ligilactobacillus agilis]MDO4597092.1 FtsW/RodA/SpoVE family cell cycle protein [Ligilactobacillus agilis]UXC62817.1 FtsW/RodA/SpoVE family cell cycle protein [Ligilactobacillus agilis]UXC64816.1 FtsW/RodA/SpoVE family cell cycle protein [Ligilactobacillus agilis]
MNNLKNKLKYFDLYLFIPYIVLSIIGIIMVYSASSINQAYSGLKSNYYLVRQIIFLFIGLIFFFVASHMNQRIWVRKINIAAFYVIVFLGLVVAVAFNKAINGAKGWINLGLFSIQPAEVCKLLMAIWLARYFAKIEQRKLRGIQIPSSSYGLLTLGILPFFGLIFATPDLGSLVINGAIILVIILAANDWSLFQKLAAFFGGLVLFYGIINSLKWWNPFKIFGLDYVYQRFIAYFDPFKVATSSGKQLVNSYYALSNGGLLGRGLGNSIQKRGYLPEPYTDFILSIIAEELGFIGVLVVLGLLLWLTLRIFLVGIRSTNTYNSLFCYGIGTFMFVETSLNVGAVCGLLPITGVTLPFVSYGGSSMLVLSVALGMVVNISVSQRRNMEFDPLLKPKRGKRK